MEVLKEMEINGAIEEGYNVKNIPYNIFDLLW